MKKLLVFFILTYGLHASAQDTIRIAFLGDSFCNGCCEPNGQDSSWRPLTIKRFEKQGYAVNELKLCNGGESILSGMWDGYAAATQPGNNITTALAWHPDIIFIEYSGNHWGYSVPYPTVQAAFHALCDSLVSIGMPFVLISGTPRQNAGIANSVYTAQTQAINADLQNRYPLQYINIYDSLKRPPVTGQPDSPRIDYLGSDNLHWTTAGYTAFANAVWKCSAIDNFLRYRPYAAAVKAVVAGKRILVSGIAPFSKIQVSAGNDRYGNFVPVKTIVNSKSKTHFYLPRSRYLYRRFELYNNSKQPIAVLVLRV